MCVYFRYRGLFCLVLLPSVFYRIKPLGYSSGSSSPLRTCAGQLSVEVRENSEGEPVIAVSQFVEWLLETADLGGAIR